MTVNRKKSMKSAKNKGNGRNGYQSGCTRAFKDKGINEKNISVLRSWERVVRLKGK